MDVKEKIPLKLKPPPWGFKGDLSGLNADCVSQYSDKTRGIISLPLGGGQSMVTIYLLASRRYKSVLLIVPTHGIAGVWMDYLKGLTKLREEDIYYYKEKTNKEIDLEKYRLVIITYA